MLSHRTRLIIALLLAFGIALAAPIAAFAHPLGNFTINRYSRLELKHDSIRVRYVVDMAEIPTFQEQSRIDLNGDSVIDAAEHDRYLSEQIADLQSNLHLIVNGEALTLKAQDSQWEFVPGQGGLQTLRLSTWLTARLPAARAWQLQYDDGNFANRLGWQEVIVKAEDINVTESSVPSQDLSNELRDYPQDLLQSPPAVSSASIEFTLIGSTPDSASFTTSALPVPSALTGRTNDRFAELIAIPELGLSAILAALIGAFVWGAAHAFSPGHGKTIVAAYLVGSRATPKHALFLGLTTTVTHTAGVFTLGLITLFASRYILPEQLYPWLETASGVLLVILGLSLFGGRMRRLRHRAPSHDHDHPHDHHDHDHVHDHPYDHDHDHTHDHQHSSERRFLVGFRTRHSHLPPGTDGSPVTWRSLLALGISGGLLPCPSALVVMLGAIALNRIAFGLLLIIVFSLGLAGTLTAIGIMMVRAKSLLQRATVNGKLFGRIPIDRRVIQALPAISALFIVLAGLGIMFAALAQAGVIKI